MVVRPAPPPRLAVPAAGVALTAPEPGAARGTRSRVWKRPPPYEPPPPPPAGSPLEIAGRFVTQLHAAGMVDGFTPSELARRAFVDPAIDTVTRAFLGTTDERRLDRALNRRLGLEVLGRRLELLPDQQGFALRPVRSALEARP